MTDGGASHPGSRDWPRPKLAELRAAELDAAIAALGGAASCVTRLGLPDGGMLGLAPRYDEIAAQVAQTIRAAGARVLIAPAPTDPHCDHEATAEIARRAARRTGARLLFYPVWSGCTIRATARGCPSMSNTASIPSPRARPSPAPSPPIAASTGR
ncbi:PIG-L deacetylase family protein [Limimaricola cinnabarinus]|nr:PIG-L family deacetylase [Limimaricola cinnabarinus]